MKRFEEIWKGYWFNNTVSVREYIERSEEHVGWVHTYNGVDIRTPMAKKESAFHIAMDAFTKRFGVFGVVEDDVLFEPLFDGCTLAEKTKI